jgi:hypothetical protein
LKTTDAEKFNAKLFNQALDYAYDQLDKKDQLTGEGKKMGDNAYFSLPQQQERIYAHIGQRRENIRTGRHKYSYAGRYGWIWKTNPF